MPVRAHIPTDEPVRRAAARVSPTKPVLARAWWVVPAVAACVLAAASTGMVLDEPSVDRGGQIAAGGVRLVAGIREPEPAAAPGSMRVVAPAPATASLARGQRRLASRPAVARRPARSVRPARSAAVPPASAPAPTRTAGGSDQVLPLPGAGNGGGSGLLSDTTRPVTGAVDSVGQAVGLGGVPGSAADKPKKVKMLGALTSGGAQ